MGTTAGWSVTSFLIVPALAIVLTLVEGLLGGGADNVVLPAVGAGLLALVT